MTAATALKIQEDVSTENKISIQDIGRFTEILSLVVSSLSKSPAIPIFEGVLVEAEGNKVTITGTDGVSSIRSVEEGITLVLGSARFVVKGKLFFEAIKKLPKGEVEIDVGENQLVMQVKVGSKRPVRFDLSLMQADEFPNFSLTKLPNGFSVSAETLNIALKGAAYATLDNETTPIFAGVHLEGDGNKIKLTSTDRHRLAIYEFELTETVDGFRNLVIANNAVKEIRKLLDGLSEEVRFDFSENQVRITTENTVFYTATIDGKFPETNKVIPTQFAAACKVNRTDMMECLERARIFVNQKFKTCYVSFLKETIEIKAQSEGHNFHEEVTVLDGKGEMKLGMDVYYLLDAFKSFSTEELIVNFSGSMTPILINPAIEGQSTKHFALVIPVRIA